MTPLLQLIAEAKRRANWTGDPFFHAVARALGDHTGTLPDFPAHGGPSPSRRDTKGKPQ